MENNNNELNLNNLINKDIRVFLKNSIDNFIILDGKIDKIAAGCLKFKESIEINGDKKEIKTYDLSVPLDNVAFIELIQKTS